MVARTKPSKVKSQEEDAIVSELFQFSYASSAHRFHVNPLSLHLSFHLLTEKKKRDGRVFLAFHSSIAR